MREYRRPNPARAVAVGAFVTVLALLPVFLTSAMAVQVTRDLAFGSVALGVAVGAFRAGGAMSGVFLGRLVDRLGATRSLRIAAVMAGTALSGVAVAARGPVSLTVLLLMSGSALSMAQPSANRLLTSIIDPRRLGTAFGIKQSAPPVASMVAGAAVPLIAVTIGWRWGFVMAAIVAFALAAGMNSPPRPAGTVARAVKTPQPRLENRGLILLLSATFGMGTFTSSATTTFYVASAVEAGSSPSFAGTLFAVASIAAISARVLSGILSDRLTNGHLALCAAMVGTGTVGSLLLATGSPRLMSIGIVIALMGNWGYNGVYWFALVRAYPDTPGQITGAVSPGGLMGSTLGPPIAGLIVQQAGYARAWTTIAAVGIAAALAMVWMGRRLAAVRPGDPA